VHPYVIDSDEHKNVTVGLAVVSVLIIWSLYGQIQTLQQQYPWWLEAPSIMSVFGLLYYAFAQWLWRWPLFRWIGLVKTPDIGGSWQGCVKSSHDKHTQEHRVTITVTQTWTKMLVSLKAERSTSKSVSAAIFVDEEDVPVLRFIYLNSPQPDAQKTMQIHHGTVVVRLEERDRLVGSYYTGRGRSNHGALVLNRA
jgi:hypothetical protein